jgi:hypothetical protein
MLRLTVLHDSGGVRLHGIEGTYVLGGWTLESPLPLNDGRFLRMHVSLYIEETQDGPRLKVRQGSFQYQADETNDRWIFRYDFLRNPIGPEPTAHLQVKADLHEQDCLPAGIPLAQVHFPTGRFSLEAIIRLLALDFHIPCNEGEAIWKPVLDSSESMFFSIAHPPIRPNQQEAKLQRKGRKRPR